MYVVECFAYVADDDSLHPLLVGGVIDCVHRLCMLARTQRSASPKSAVDTIPNCSWRVVARDRVPV